MYFYFSRPSFKQPGISQLAKIQKDRYTFPVTITALKPLNKCLPLLLALHVQIELRFSQRSECILVFNKH